MSSDCFLAFDTSAYTTSVAAVSGGHVLYDRRVMLNVEKGGKGLRQSEAVFQHIKNIKSIFLEFPTSGCKISGIGYSEKPCPNAKSYMPVFCVGESVALSCARVLGVRSFAFTHQHGHIYSSFFGNTASDDSYIVFHVSGGTSDILRVDIKNDIVAQIVPIGGTLDITCGQLIDRVGVAAGLLFPSGGQMESIYIKNGAELSVRVDDLNANLSGAEAQALRLLQNGRSAPYVCSGVIDCVAETLCKLVENAAEQAGSGKFIFTGGVICNKIIRKKIEDLCAKKSYECIMTPMEYCGDNACGLALAAQVMYGKGEKL